MKWIFTLVGLLIAAVSLTITGAQVLPPALWVIQLRAAADDPVEIANLRLRRSVSSERIDTEIKQAIEESDEDLALSFIALAGAEGIPIQPASRQQVEDLQRTAARRAVNDFADGLVSGTTDSMSGLAGAFAGDVVGYGDLRDMWQQGSKLASGEDYDEIILGMSVLGLAVTGATWALLGTGAPARAGLTAIKTAKKAGRVSKPLARTLTGVTWEVIDADALKAALKTAGRFDLTGSRRALSATIRPSAMGSLRELSDDAAALYSRLGSKGMMQALSVAENADDLRRTARLSVRMGAKTRAVLKVLGRGAIALGAAFASLVQWVWAALAWVFALALFSRRLGDTIGQLIWRQPANSC